MTHKLVHSGIGYISMVDFDQITLLSLNCHVTVTLKDMDLPQATRLVMMFQIHKKTKKRLQVFGGVYEIRHHSVEECP